MLTLCPVGIVSGRFRQRHPPIQQIGAECIQLVPGLGVEGDAHSEASVQHVYDMKKRPGRPNLRQIHLLQAELFDELNARGLIFGPAISAKTSQPGNWTC